MLAIINAAAAASDEPYTPPATAAGSAFFEPFTSRGVAEARWTISEDAEFTGRWKHEAHLHDALAGDTGLVVGDAARKHAVSALFGSAVDPKGKGLVVQYELQLKQALQCGGAYLKLLTASDELSADGFKAETPYTIMFGPDRCGGTNKVHFILRHKNPLSGEWEEKHLQVAADPRGVGQDDPPVHGGGRRRQLGQDPRRLGREEERLAPLRRRLQAARQPAGGDRRPRRQEARRLDRRAADGRPGATKPDDWDEEAPKMIVDPAASKPADWLDDAPDMVARPQVLKPDDWDEDEDGEWEAPLIENPNCVKGPGAASGCRRRSPTRRTRASGRHRG